jgi:hypothetical protein
MSRTLFRGDGGTLVLPDASSVLATRLDGGNLLVNPPRPVWERSELSADELTQWAFLVGAAGAAMLDALPQLDGGCINYWEAGNWALNDAAEPVGPKRAREHRRMHLHLLGRSRTATHPSWRWGESPRFPEFAERHDWSAGHERLTADECRLIVERVEARLVSVYGVARARIAPWHACPACAYPTADAPSGAPCRECASVR